jgi:hypothetical protein
MGRFDSIMPGDNLPVMLLTGHLLIEERLNALLESLAADPAAIRASRLRFGQLASIAKGLRYERQSAWVWSAIADLNTMRNRLAHRLEAGDLKAEIAAYVDRHLPILRRYYSSPRPRRATPRFRALIELIVWTLLLLEIQGSTGAAT